MPRHDLSAWERVGPLLTARRVEISPRYANRVNFAAERGVNWRTAHDAERAKRSNFTDETLRQLESAYMLVPGSLDRTLAGDDLEPAPAERPAAPPAGPEGPRSLDELVDTVVQMLIRMIPPGADRGALEALWQLPPPVYTVERKLVLLAALGDAASSAASPAAEDAGEEGGALRRLPGRAG